ncbi:MAG: KH domain-containing protein [Candidatus Binatia bacterium]
MKELLEYVVRYLVNDPDAVAVSVTQGDAVSILGLRVAKADLGRVIGKDGRTVMALRTVLNAVAARSHQKVALEILES